MKQGFVVAVIMLALSIHPASAFDFKGDVVGELTLYDFKFRHYRTPGGPNAKPAPQCTDTSPGAVTLLLAQPWYLKNGLVHCQTHFPYEWHQGRTPTIAGVETEFSIYRFVDGTLASIIIAFPSNRYRTVTSALKGKFGQPTEVMVEDVQNRMGAVFRNEKLTWVDGVNTIETEQLFGNLDRSVVMFLNGPMERIRLQRIAEGQPVSSDL